MITIYQKFKRIIRHSLKSIVESNIAKYLNSYTKIQHDYSFIVLGNHGVGLHSLLYYLSICKNKKNQHVYPMPIFIFSKNFDLFGHFSTLRFFKKMFPIISDNQTTWCLTFDGGNIQNQRWIHNNIKKVPIISIVRDPILSTISAFNYEIFCYIHAKHKVDYNKIYSYIFDNLQSIIGYTRNFKNIEGKRTKCLFIDCAELTGHTTYPTMQKVAEFLDLDVSPHEVFLHSINSPIQRYFATPIIYNGEELYLSAIPNFYRLTCYPYYFYPNYCNNLGYIFRKDYHSKTLPQQKLFLFSKVNIVVTPELRATIEAYLENYKNIMKEYEKLKIDSSILLNLIQRHNHVNYIQKFLEEEISIVPQEITEKWEAYSKFSKIKG